MTSRHRARYASTAASRLRRAKGPIRLTTTLYDVAAALQAVTEPDQDQLAVAVLVDWVRSGRLTAAGDLTLTG
jgi:hypothetical protein